MLLNDLYNFLFIKLLYELIIVLFFCKTIKSFDVYLNKNNNEIFEEINNHLIQHENYEEINFYFDEIISYLKPKNSIFLNINTNVTFWGNNENKTLLDLADFITFYIDIGFDKNNKSLIFKNFIFTKSQNDSIFLIKDRNSAYQLIFENCIFENNNAILGIQSNCQNEKDKKQTIFNNCQFM